MVLSDVTLRERLPEIVDPYDEGRVQPASYDVELGPTFRVCENHKVSFVEIADPPKRLTRELTLDDLDPKLTIHPGEFVLGATREVVTIPDDLVCSLMGRSSIGRLGLTIHATAGWVDPGFHGVITLEMTNNLRVPIVVRPGLVIGQLAFQRLVEPAAEPYAGRYQNDLKVAPSRYGEVMPSR